MFLIGSFFKLILSLFDWYLIQWMLHPWYSDPRRLRNATKRLIPVTDTFHRIPSALIGQALVLSIRNQLNQSQEVLLWTGRIAVQILRRLSEDPDSLGSLVPDTLMHRLEAYYPEDVLYLVFAHVGCLVKEYHWIIDTRALGKILIEQQLDWDHVAPLLGPNALQILENDHCLAILQLLVQNSDTAVKQIPNKTSLFQLLVDHLGSHKQLEPFEPVFDCFLEESIKSNLLQHWYPHAVNHLLQRTWNPSDFINSMHFGFLKPFLHRISALIGQESPKFCTLLLQLVNYGIQVSADSDFNVQELVQKLESPKIRLVLPKEHVFYNQISAILETETWYPSLSNLLQSLLDRLQTETHNKMFAQELILNLMETGTRYHDDLEFGSSDFWVQCTLQMQSHPPQILKPIHVQHKLRPLLKSINPKRLGTFLLRSVDPLLDFYLQQISFEDLMNRLSKCKTDVEPDTIIQILSNKLWRGFSVSDSMRSCIGYISNHREKLGLIAQGCLMDCYEDMILNGQWTAGENINRIIAARCLQEPDLVALVSVEMLDIFMRDVDILPRPIKMLTMIDSLFRGDIGRFIHYTPVLGDAMQLTEALARRDLLGVATRLVSLGLFVLAADVLAAGASVVLLLLSLYLWLRQIMHSRQMFKSKALLLLLSILSMIQLSSSFYVLLSQILEIDTPHQHMIAFECYLVFCLSLPLLVIESCLLFASNTSFWSPSRLKTCRYVYGFLATSGYLGTYLMPYNDSLDILEQLLCVLGTVFFAGGSRVLWQSADAFGTLHTKTSQLLVVWKKHYALSCLMLPTSVFIYTAGILIGSYFESGIMEHESRYYAHVFGLLVFVMMLRAHSTLQQMLLLTVKSKPKHQRLQEIAEDE
ncbi:hypothetical protein EDD86DRAFT_249738 [Gorgonomyces haynaldii]|nr:hypothetical protein EDD86DRAFT_249738 [Gorgonomyces haynaldii]